MSDHIKRLFRFSLLTLLITIAVVSVLLAIGVKRANNQKAVIAWATKTGGMVSYDFAFDTQDRAIGHYDENNQFVSDAMPPGPDWLRNSIGVDFFASINGVYVRGREVSDLSPLTRLPDLQAVNILATNVSDLSPLSALTKLRVVIWHQLTPEHENREAS